MSEQHELEIMQSLNGLIRNYHGVNVLSYPAQTVHRIGDDGIKRTICDGFVHIIDFGDGMMARSYTLAAAVHACKLHNEAMTVQDQPEAPDSE